MERKKYMIPATKWLRADDVMLLSGSTTSDGDPIGNDDTPGNGDDQAGRYSNPFDDENWDNTGGVWDE